METVSNFLARGNKITLTRRSVIKLPAIAGLLTLAACSSQPPVAQSSSVSKEILSDQPKGPIVVTPIPAELREEKYSNTVDMDYIRQTLIPILATPKGTVDSRLLATIDSISWIRNEKGGGTALMVDESGYYITVAHNFFQIDKDKPSNSPLIAPTFEAYHPKTGIISRVSKILISLEDDFALVYAPNGKPPKAEDAMQITWSLPEPPARLWTLFMQQATPPVLDIGVTTGLYRNWSPDDQRNGFVPSQLQQSFVMEGAQPWFGASGGPIIDSQGVVVGLEQGSYPEAQNVSDLLGGIGIPLSPLPFGLNQSVTFNEDYR